MTKKDLFKAEKRKGPRSQSTSGPLNIKLKTRTHHNHSPQHEQDLILKALNANCRRREGSLPSVYCLVQWIYLGKAWPHMRPKAFIILRKIGTRFSVIYYSNYHRQKYEIKLWTEARWHLLSFNLLSILLFGPSLVPHEAGYHSMKYSNTQPNMIYLQFFSCFRMRFSKSRQAGILVSSMDQLSVLRSFQFQCVKPKSLALV